MPAASIRDFADNTVDPHVRGFLHLPAPPNGDALVLSHGAGSNAQAPLLIAVAETFSAAGFIVLRCDLPYRQLRSFGPPGPGEGARDRAGLRNAIAAISETLVPPHLSRPLRQGGNLAGDQEELKGVKKIFLGGHSYGGRQSSMLCAEEPELVAGLLLLSYPLHPPRRPEQQRTQHLPNLRTPTLFVSGTRDAFGSIAEIEQARKMIPAKTRLFPVEGAGHDLGFKGKTKREELSQTIFAEFMNFVS